jgi:DNA polymerase I-like protein with 3'-5' exonuclease and polymerase domains
MNIQNQPKIVRKVFVPGRGNAFVNGDFKSLELFVMAYDFGDKALIRACEEKRSPHDDNTKDMFGIEKPDPNWSNLRSVAKKGVFGRSYGGGLRGIYERLCAEEPDLIMTFAQYKAADKRYFDAHPALVKGFDEAANTATTTRCCTTATGRKRFFLGTLDEVAREGINTRIQSVAGDIENETLIDLYPICLEHKWLMLVSVHDSNLIECPIADIDECAETLRATMEKPRKLWGKSVVFPADIEVSLTSWGEMVNYEEWKRKAKKRKA